MKKKFIKYIVIPLTVVAVLLLALITVGIVSSVTIAGNQVQAYADDFSELADEVEAYRNMVAQYAKDNGIEEYTDNLLCIIQVSTNGKGTDVMNAGEFSFNTKFPKKRGMITEPEYSIECGVKEFKELISLAGVSSNTDSEKLLVVYQSYHLNRGYIDFANGTYTPDNAKSYCEKNSLGEHFNYNFAEQVSFYLASLKGNGEFIYPLSAYHSVSSPYGYRYSPITGEYQLHTGTDFPAPQGTPVLASMAGIVERAETMGGYGNCVVIKHNAKYTTYYAHNVSLVVKKGEQVQQGQIIAYVGSTGNSTGAHCHFEIRENGKSTDPLPYLNGTNRKE